MSGPMEAVFSRLRHAHFRTRATEWALGIIMLSLGIALWREPTAFAANPFFAELARMQSQGFWVAVFSGLGAFRLVVLTINGSWRRTPHMRVLSSVLSMAIWYQLNVSVFLLALPNTGVAIYPWFLVLELYNVLFAAADARDVDASTKAGSGA